LGFSLNFVRLCPFFGQRKNFFGQSWDLAAAQSLAPLMQGALVDSGGVVGERNVA